MKRFFLFISALLPSISICAGNKNDTASGPKVADTTAIELQAIEIVATKAPESSASTTTTLSSEEISKRNFGYDIPSILTFSPSLIASSEAGIGIGGTSLRIRGTDGTRINVNMNGMPLNDPDSHTMYWYDTPDLAGGSGSIQIVRGAGTATNGTGAFGGAVNISSASLKESFVGDAALSYGSYNTNREAIHIGSGLMGDHWILDLRLSHTGSDGYIDRGWTKMGSYMCQLGYLNEGTILKLISFGGKSKTYLSYDGVSPEDLASYGPRYHTSGQYKTSDGPYVLKDGTHVNYFDDQTDNYLQIDNQLILDHIFSERWSMNAMAYYCYGNGFYRQYKDDAWLCAYDNLVGTTERADLIRRKNMESNRAGTVINGIFNTEKVKLVFGGAYMYYGCPHNGTLDWVDGQRESLYEGFVWYSNNVSKHDANLYAKTDWMPVRGLVLHAELQYRLVSYRSLGTNDNYDWTRGIMQEVNVDKLWNFVNPCIGAGYEFGRHHAVNFSLAMANKEPTRSDFTDRYNFSELTEEPVPETLLDWELSYCYTHPVVRGCINFYYMQYKNQLVPTGIVNDSEDNLNVNVDDSFRRGVELMLDITPLRWFKFGGNCTLSQNRINDFDEVIGGEHFHHDQVDIAYSPSVLAAGFLDFHIHGFEGVVRAQYVGRQYISNENHEDLSLPGYCVANIDLGYTLPQSVAKATIRFGLRISNFINARYCSYGYGGSYMAGGKRESWCCLFPQAPCNAIGNVTISF